MIENEIIIVCPQLHEHLVSIDVGIVKIMSMPDEFPKS